MNSTDTKIVITGIGVISPIANGLDDFIDALLNNVDGIRPLQTLDVTDFRTTHGGEYLPFDALDYDVHVDELVDPCGLLAICASSEALRCADIDQQYLIDNPYRVSTSIAILSGGLSAFENYVSAKYRNKPVDSRITLNTPSRIAQFVARYFQIKGPVVVPSTACSASINSVVAGIEMLQLNEVDLVLAGGADPITRSTYVGFNVLQAVARGKCRPFDEGHDGIAIGSGSVIFTLERKTDAVQRGATIYAEITGYGLTNDAYHITAPEPSGRGLRASMAKAMEDGGYKPSDINFICAHGTGTPHNDSAELTAIAKVFNEHAKNIPIVSIKSAVGHTMGTAGAMNILACIVALQKQIVPGTIHLEKPLAEFDSWNLPNISTPASVEVALTNALAFGGHTSSIILTAG